MHDPPLSPDVKTMDKLLFSPAGILVRAIVSEAHVVASDAVPLCRPVALLELTPYPEPAIVTLAPK